MKLYLYKKISPLKRWCAFAVLGLLGAPPVGFVRRLALRALSLKPLNPASFTSGAAQSYQLRDPSVMTRCPPCLVGKNPQVSYSSHPALNAYIVHDSIATPYASGVVVKDGLLLPDEILTFRHSARTDGGKLFHLGRRYCLEKVRRPAHLPQGILIGGAGAFNWYHFFIECLPKAYLAQSFPEHMSTWPLLVPDECLRYPSFGAALAVLSGDRPIYPMARGETVKVDRLAVVDEISYGPFNIYKNIWPKISDYSQHDIFLMEYLQEMRSCLAPSDAIKVPFRRLFLVRPGIRRNYNQDQLLSIAQKYGFEAFSPETLPLPEQARKFSEAEMVVGASGAAWVGMVFCQSSTQFLSWLPDVYREFCSYSNLAQVLGHRMAFLESISDKPIKSSDDAYTHSYQVDPEMFESALQNMSRAT